VLNHFIAAVMRFVEAVFLAGGYPGIVLLMAIESACIPLPSELIMPYAGYLVAQGKLNYHAASLAGAFGCAVGSALAYYVGLYGGRPFIDRYGRYILMRHKDMDRAEVWFNRYGGATVFWSRLLPVVRTFISLPAGIARMPFVPFITLSFVGSVPWCYFLTYLGVLFGRNAGSFEAVHRRITGYFHGADAVIGIGLLVLIVLFVRHHLKEEPEAADQETPGAGSTRR
jgi:membrane protein DedA with SNARE-associated domain